MEIKLAAFFTLKFCSHFRPWRYTYRFYVQVWTRANQKWFSFQIGVFSSLNCQRAVTCIFLTLMYNYVVLMQFILYTTPGLQLRSSIIINLNSSVNCFEVEYWYFPLCFEHNYEVCTIISFEVSTLKILLPRCKINIFYVIFILIKIFIWKLLILETR